MSDPLRDLQRVEVLGVGVHMVTRRELLDAVAAMIEAARAGDPRRYTIACANVHVLNQAVRHADLAAFLNRADICYCDGNGLRHGARILGQPIPERRTGADWIWDLAWRAERQWRIWWIGGEPGVTELAAAHVKERFGALQIGTDHGFHARDGVEDAACLARLNAFEPDIVLVGMVTPEQERWVDERRERIDAPVVWCQGASADLVAGKVRRGPAWAVEHAEWLTRLAAEPRRLAHRYLVGNTGFLARVLWQRLTAGSPATPPDR